MRQAGRYLPEYRKIRAQASDFLKLCLTPELAAEVTLQPIRRFCFDGAILFADILLIPHALGQRVWFAEGEGPKLGPLEPKTLKPSNVRASLAPVFETIVRVRSELPPQTTLIGFAGAPWTVATYMIAGGSSDEAVPARLFAHQHPGDFEALINILVDATADYLIAQLEAGAEALQLFESWAGALPAAWLESHSIKPIKRIIDRVRDHTPSVPIIVFPRGAGGNYPLYAKTGATALSVDTQTSLSWLHSRLPGMPLQGNLDPLALVAGGEALDRAITDVLRETQDTPHIFNLGHGIRPETPTDNVSRLLRQVADRRA
jgi:uroporphyrinogen decarboxylase